MNILSIAIKEIKQDFRDWRTILFMLCFPIVLMLILGLALTNAFSSEVSIGDVKVVVKDATGGGPLSEAFAAFTKEVGKMGVTFEPLKPGMDGREEVENNRYADYVELTNQGISMYGSSRDAIESNIVQGMLASFTDKYNATAAVASIEPAKTEMVLASGGSDYIKESSVDPNRTPGSIDYYALAMTVMVGMWAAMAAGGLIQGEVWQRTAVRLVIAPIRKSEIFAGKILGGLVSNLLCVIVIIVFSKYVFKAYWGHHMGIVIIVLISEVVMAMSFGLAGSYLLKGAASRGIISLVVQLLSFFGGAYFPIGDDSGGGVMGFLVNLSPIRWANHGLTQVIYGNNVSAAWPVVMLNIGFAVLFLGVSIFAMRRREGL
ncbi:ABC transporter permease [Paenibacillus albilobatus]|uniref:ABC transporter permease n=1 Tax=Paenibacillus albilobatus TaxID=2716884 RepID=A0A919XJ83_9BACL|nr:ABC transporter permease [Paenibacillus albilobatus]GIO32393.1 ABC transporter permease [Paenibacillus albilobatus]